MEEVARGSNTTEMVIFFKEIKVDWEMIDEN